MATPDRGAHPLQRLVLLTALLGDAGSRGLVAGPLAERLGYGGTPESRRESLARDIRKLRDTGIEIVNAAASGEEARWVLHPRDSRIRLAFTGRQVAELARAALLADREAIARQLGSPAPAVEREVVSLRPSSRPAALDPVLRAVAARCELRFVYNGRPRIFDPAALQPDAGGWSLSGWDRGRAEPRTYRVSRMTAVELGEPGTARQRSEVTGRSTDPLAWLVDEPLTVQLRAFPRYEGDLRRLLGTSVSRIGPDGPRDGEALASYETVVTNRWVFLARVMELGERVRLDGPPPLRDELARRLHAAIEVAS